MTGILNALIAGVSGAVKDAYFNLVSLLLPGNGTNGAQNNTFLDSGTANSGSGFTITRNGNTTQGTFSPFSQTGWGNYFSGSSYLIGPTSNAAMNLGTDAYTIEGWIYLTAYTGALYESIIFCAGNANGAIAISVLPTGAFNLSKYGTGTVIATSANEILLNTWYHVAVSRASTASNDTKLYINGVLKATGTDNNNWNVYTTPTVGALTIANFNVSGYLSNVRVVKGVAVYTGAFTPPILPLTATQSAGTNIAAITGTQTSLLTCQSNRFRDASNNTLTITTSGSPSVTPFSPFAPTQSYSAAAVGGSGYFDGTGDYLDVANNAALQLGTSDFTLETWAYLIDQAGTKNHMAVSKQNYYLYYQEFDSKWVFETNLGSILSSSAWPMSTWQHIAATRSGNTFTLWINGTSQGTLTNSGSVTDAGGLMNIGRNVANSDNFTLGYLSNTRLVKGTAVYTGAFTPPSLQPLTNAGSTSAAAYPSTTNVNTSFASSACSLLLNFTNAGVVDATAKNDLETVGNAQISTSVSKFGGGSMSFDGSGDWLSSPASPIWIMSGDWTLEGWIYPNSVTGVQVLIDTRNRVSGGSSPVFYLNGTSLVIDTGAGAVISAGTISLGSSGGWQHIAATRSGNSWRLFINGSQVGSTTTNTTSFTTAYGCTLGSSATNEYYNGYMDDVRVTKYARYTGSTYTVPTAPFPVQ